MGQFTILFLPFPHITSSSDLRNPVVGMCLSSCFHSFHKFTSELQVAKIKLTSTNARVLTKRNAPPLLHHAPAPFFSPNEGMLAQTPESIDSHFVFVFLVPIWFSEAFDAWHTQLLVLSANNFNPQSIRIYSRGRRNEREKKKGEEEETREKQSIAHSIQFFPCFLRFESMPTS